MADEFTARINAELNLDKIEDQIKELNNRKIKLSIEVDGDQNKKLAKSIENGLKNTKFDTSSVAKQIADSFNISDKSLVTKMKSQLNSMMADLAKSWDGMKFDFSKAKVFDSGIDDLADSVIKNASIIESKMGIYDKFYDYFKGKKIYVSDQLKAAMGEDTYKELLKNNIGQIVRDASKGVSLNSLWGEMTSLFPEHFSQNTINEVDQIVSAFSVLKAARADIARTISFDDMTDVQKTNVTDDVYRQVLDATRDMKQNLEQSIMFASDALKNEVIIDVSVNSDKIITDIRQAVQQASVGSDTPINIALDVNEEELRNKIKSAISGISAEQIPIEIDENEINSKIHGAIQSLPIEEILVNVDETELRTEIERVVSGTTAEITLEVDRQELENNVRAALSGIDFPVDFRVDEDELRNRIRQAISGMDDLEIDVNVNIVNLQNSLRQGIQNIPPVDVDILNHVNRAGRDGQDIFSAFGMTLRDAFSAFTLANLLECGIDEVIDAGKEAIQTVKELDDAATNLRMATGSSKAEAKQMIADYNALGQELGALTTEVGESADAWLRQGKSARETEKLIKESMVLSKVAQISGENSTKYLTSAMQGYKVAVDDVGKINDKLTSIDLVSATDAGGLAEAMSRTAESADIAGVSMDRLLAILATTGEVTQRSMTSIGESYKTIFARMRDIKANKLSSVGEDGEIEDLSQVEEVLGSLGIKLRASNQEFRNFQTVIDEVAASWNNYSTVQQAAIAKAFAGQRQQENFLVMMENYDKVLKYTDVAANSEGTSLEKFGYYAESLEAKTKSLQASLEALATDTISDDLYAWFLDNAKAAADFATETDLVKSALVGIGTAGPTFVFTRLATLIENTTSRVMELGGGLRGLWALMSGNPVALVTAAVTAGVTAWNMYQSAIKKQVDDAKQSASAWSEQNDSIQSHIDKITELRSALDFGKLTEEQAYEAKKQLFEIQTSLTESYSDQISGIDLLNGSLETQIDLLNQLSKVEADKLLTEKKSGIQKATEEMEKERTYSILEDYGSQAYMADEIKKLAEKYGLQVENTRFGDSFTIKFVGDATEAEDVLNQFAAEVRSTSKQLGDENGIFDFLETQASNSISEAKSVIEEYGELYNQAKRAELFSGEKKYKFYGADNEKAKTSAEWMKDYTDAIKAYNEALVSGDTTKISEAATQFEKVDTAVQNLLDQTSMGEFADQFKEVRQELNDTAIVYNDFVNAISNGTYSSGAGKRTNLYSQQLKQIGLTDVDFMDAFATEGNQMSERAVQGMITAAKDMGYISDLSSEQVQKLCDKLVELGIISTGTGSSVNDAGSEIASAFDEAINSTDSLLSRINAVNSALTSQANGKSIDLATFNSDELKDYQSALEYTNGTLQLNADKVKEITKAKSNEVIAYNDAQKALAQTKYIENARQIDDYREKLENLDKSSSNYADTYKTLMDNINNLSLQNDSIVDECTQWDLLSASIREATGEYQTWLNSQNASDYGDMFSDSVNAINKVRDTLINTESDSYGNIGSVKYKAALDLMLPDTIDLKDGEAVRSYMRDTLNKYLTFDNKGNATGMDIGSFLNSAVEKGLMTVDENNDFRIAGGKSMQNFVDGMNLSLPMVQAFFDMLQLKGAEYTFAPAEDSLEGLGQKAYEASDALRQLEQFKDLEINMDVSDIDTNEGKIQALQSTIEQMQNERATLSVDSSEYEQVNSIIAYCMAQKQELEQPVIMSVSAALIDGELGSAISLLQEFQTATNNLEMQQSLGLDTSEAQGQIDSLVTEIQNLGNTEAGGKVLVDLGINPESQSTIEASLSVMKPEVLTDLGIGIDDATPKIDEINAKQLNDKEFSVSVNDRATGILNTINNTVLNDKSFTITTNRVTVNSTKNEGEGQLNGTAHVSGTAKVTGDWGMPSSQRVLIGELGREIVVDPHTGKWRTYGDNGAEFATIPKDAIVFNHIQSKSLLENGYVNSRATAMLRGTAFASGNAYGNGNQKVSGVFRWTGGSSNASSTSSTTSTTSNNQYANSLNNVTKSTKKASTATNKLTKSFDAFKKWTEKLVDWVEVKINRQQENMDLNLAQAENKVGYINKNDSVSKAQATQKLLIATNAAGEKKYLEQANAVKANAVNAKMLNGKTKTARNKRADDLIKLIQEGAIDISQYGEKEREFINQYTTWYDKAVACRQAVEDLNKEQRELAQTKLDNITDQYEAFLSHLEHQADLINGFIDQSEMKGYVESAKYYEALMTNTVSQRTDLEKERAALIASLQESMNSGVIQKDSVEWANMQSQINDVSKAIQDADSNLLEFSNKIREIQWARFDMGQEAISRITDETEFLIKLMSNDDLFDDNGNTTEQGMATFGLYGVNYNTYMEQAQQYRDEMLKINSQIAKDPNNTTLLKRREELLDLQRDSILAAEEEKQAIKDLVKDGIDKQLSSLQELIDKYKDALNSASDLADYQKDVADQTSEIARLQKQLQAFGNDDSEEGRLRAQKAKNDLKEAQDNLKETEYDRYISDYENLLDNLYTEYEEILTERLSDVDQLISDTITSINDNSGIIGDTLREEASSVGTTLSTSLDSLWGEKGTATTVLSTFAGDFATRATTLQSAIDRIVTGVENLGKTSDTQAQTDVNSTAAGGGSNPVVDKVQTPSGGNDTPKAEAPKTDKILSIIQSGKKRSKKLTSKEKKDHNKLWEYLVSKYGYAPNNSIYKQLAKELNVKVSKTVTTKQKWKILDALKAKKYASGTKYVKKDEWANINEQGQEILTLPDGSIQLPDGSILKHLTKGTGVINNPNTEKLLGLADNYEALQRVASSVDTGSLFNRGVGLNGVALAGNKGNNNIDCNISFTLPNVMNYEQFMSKMQHDPKFDGMIQSMTIGRINGKTALNKYKYNFK